MEVEVKPGQAELTAGELEADSCPNSDVRQTHRSKRRSIASAGTRARRRLPCAERRRHLGQADALEGCSRGTRFAKIVQQRDSFSRVTLRTFWNVASERGAGNASERKILGASDKRNVPRNVGTYVLERVNFGTYVLERVSFRKVCFRKGLKTKPGENTSCNC